MIAMPDLSAFHFIRPVWLWLAAGALAVIAGMALRDRLARFQMGGTVDPHLLKHLVLPAGHRRWLRPVHATSAGLVVAAIGAAGPTWQQEAPPFSEDKAPLVIVLETSWTMNAIDVQPTRLKRATDKIRTLLAARAGARTALIAYAGSAHVVMPFTDDGAAIDLFLPGLDPSIMPVAGDDAAAAVAMADEMLAKDTVPGSVLLVTDGVPASQHDRLAAVSARHQLLVLAVGTSAGGPIRTGENKFQTTATGARAIAKLDKTGLEALGDRTGALVASLTLDDRDIDRIQLSVQRHMQAVEASDRQARWHDAGYYLVFPLVALGAWSFRRGWTVRWALALVLAAAPALSAQTPTYVGRGFGPALSSPASFHFIDLWLTRDQQGRRAFERGDFKTAAERFVDPMWKGLACYRSGDLPCAVDAWSRVETPESNYDLGNALARLGEYKLAVAAYDQALAARPAFEDARANRELVVNAMRKPKPDDETEEAPDLPPDKVVFDDKGEKGKKGKVEQQLVQKAMLADTWLKSVQAGPGDFMRMKFAAEVRARGTR
jgi:Ca-activated chloride channel family protein